MASTAPEVPSQPIYSGQRSAGAPMPPPTMPVYQPLFLEAYMPHDMTFVVVCRPPLFVRLISKSGRWDGRPAVEHYYYWKDPSGAWHEHIVGITSITDVYTDKDQPSIGWERYFQYLGSLGFSFSTQPSPAPPSFNPLLTSRFISNPFNDVLSGIPKGKALGDALPRGLNDKPLAPTLEELWKQGIMPSAKIGGKLCQFSLLNSGVASDAAPTADPPMATLAFPTAEEILGMEATPRPASAATPRQADLYSWIFGDMGNDK